MPDRIDYTRSFFENVTGRTGQLRARFRLDADGRPQYSEEEGLRHYLIDIYLSGEKREEIKCVNYFMDDPSYYDPDGSSDDIHNDFQEEISSYGDVEIKVTVEKKGHQKFVQRAWLSQMLENGHAAELGDMEMDTPKSKAIRAALQRIKAN